MLLCAFPANLSGQWTHLIIFDPEGSLILWNRITKGNMKPELYQTQAIYPL